MGELRPCPFCGEAGAMRSMQDYPPQDGSYWWAVVFCDECGSEGPPTRASSKTEAESDAEIAWNDRASPCVEPTRGESGAG